MAGRALMLTGASGLVGGRLAPRLLAQGWELRALSRSDRRSSADGVQHFRWDGVHPSETALRGVQAVVHLAGEPVFGGVPTRARRDRIASSRIESTRAIAGAISALPEEARPQTLICASAVGYYGERGEEELDEDASPGQGFLADLCVAWEEAAARAADAGVRVVSLRIGLVLAREGGALPMMARPFRLGLGGKLGHGRQWVPWVHIDDVIGLCERALDPSGGLPRIVNAVAPGCVRNAELTRALAAQLRRPALLAVPSFALRAALGELSIELLGSHRVVPKAALAAGFSFAHPELGGALAEALGDTHEPGPNTRKAAGT